MSRRWLVVIAMAIISLGLTFGPASAATAVDVVSPVDPVPDLPSRTIKMAPTASWNEGKVVQMWRAILTESVKPGKDLATVPKPITPAATVARGAGGSMILPFYVGYAIGTAGLHVYAAATNTTYESLQCSTPPWYQAANDFIALGMQPDCYAAVATFSEGSAVVGGTMSYGGYTFAFNGPTGAGIAASSQGANAGKPVLIYCRTSNPSSSTHGVSLVRIGGSPIVGSWTLQSGTNCPSGTATPLNNVLVEPYEIGTYELRSTATGQTVASVTPQRVEGKDQTRTPSCSIDWEDGTTTTGVGEPYVETEGFAPDPSRTGCKTAWDAKPGAGPALLPDRIRLDSEDETGARTEISRQDVPDMSPSERRALEPGISRGLVLEKIVNDQTLSCMTWEADCVNWWAATQSGTQGTTQDGHQYRCRFDGEAVDLAECGVYRHTFDTKTSTPTVTDPQTGTSQPWSAQPNPGNSLNPGTSIGSQPGTPGAQCMSSYPSLANPIDWVLHPVKCALVWAFVPRASEIDNFHGTVQGRYNSSAVGSTLGALAGLGSFFAVAEGCGGLPFEMDLPGGIHIETQLFEACSEPMAGVAATVKSVLTFAIIGGAALAIVRYFSGLFAFNPLGITDPNEGARGGVSFK